MLQQESCDGAVHCIMLTTLLCMPTCCCNVHSALSWSAEPVCAHVKMSQQSLVHTGSLLSVESCPLYLTALRMHRPAGVRGAEARVAARHGAAEADRRLGAHGAIQRLRCLLAADHRQKGGCSFTHCRGLTFPVSRMLQDLFSGGENCTLCPRLGTLGIPTLVDTRGYRYRDNGES